MGKEEAGWYAGAAVCLQEKGLYQQALEAWDTAIAHDFSRAEYFSNRGVAKLQLKNLEGAYQDFTEAIRRRPDEPVFFINRAKCAFYLGRMESAKEDSDKAISLDPGNSVYWGQRGYLLFALKEFREAADCFAAASRFDPQPQYLMMRARAFLCLGDRVKAREVLTEVTEAFGFRTILANRQAMSSAAVLN